MAGEYRVPKRRNAHGRKQNGKYLHSHSRPLAMVTAAAPHAAKRRAFLGCRPAPCCFQYRARRHGRERNLGLYRLIFYSNQERVVRMVHVEASLHFFTEELGVVVYVHCLSMVNRKKKGTTHPMGGPVHTQPIRWADRSTKKRRRRTLQQGDKLKHDQYGGAPLLHLYRGVRGGKYSKNLPDHTIARGGGDGFQV